MKKITKQLAVVGIYALAGNQIASAATINVSSGNPEGGAGYAFHVTLGAGDRTNPFVGTVGSWSWEDARLGDGVGWRHQARWISVTLSEYVELVFTVGRNDETDDAKLFPSFTLYQGLTDNGAVHVFDNTGDIDWDGNGIDLFYIGHVDNSTLGSASATFSLAAGEYSIALGGNAVSEDDPVNVNFTATLQAIPEPSSLALIAIGLIPMFRRSR